MFNLPDLDTLVSLASDEDPTSIKDLIGVGAVKRVEVWILSRDNFNN
jgi:hypothetical protein